jgi:hypothetical protein
MKKNYLLAVMASALVLSACGKGDVNLNPTNSVSNSNNNTTNNTGGTTKPENPCAKYARDGQDFQGTVTGKDCVYPASFVSDSRPLTVSLSLAELPSGGVHIFEDSLFVGVDVDQNAADAGVKVPQEGEGASISFAPGSKVAFKNGQDYLRIARGSKIIAEGTKEKPIIFSHVTDLRDGLGKISDRGLWGGIQINGNGLTNKCTDAQRAPKGTSAHNCHVASEGLPGTYGGNNNSESSGVLKYVIVKHAGYKVVEGNELNALTFNAVGSKTQVDYVQAYAGQDDGFEFFGGAVNAKHIVALGNSDDSFDFTDGYTGNIQYALSIHPVGVGGNHCVEADNTGTGRADNIAPQTKVRISNLTCISNNLKKGTGNVPSPDGDSNGLLIREGMFIEIYNAIVTYNTFTDLANAFPGWTFDDTEGPETIKAAQDGWTVVKGSIISAHKGITSKKINAANAAFDAKAWFTAGGNALVTETANLPAVVIEGAAANANGTAYLTAKAFSDATTLEIKQTPYDASQLLDTFTAAAVPATGATGVSKFFAKPAHIGAAAAENDWVAGWVQGL